MAGGRKKWQFLSKVLYVTPSDESTRPVPVFGSAGTSVTSGLSMAFAVGE